MVAGDFNIEIAQPRTEEEAGLRDRLFAWFGGLGVSPVPGSGHTRRGRKGKACIDATIAVAEGQAWRWRVAKAWRGDLSDHVRLQIVAGGRASVGRACTPAAMRSLPAAALVDLGRVFFHVRFALGSQTSGRISRREGARTITDLPVRPGVLPALHPALGIACEGRCRPPCSACALQDGGVHEQQGLCDPPSDRRRARGTLRATEGAVNQRTRGRAAAGPRERRERDGGRARRTSGDKDDGDRPLRDEGGGRGGDPDGCNCGWDPVKALFIGPFIEHAIRGWWRRHRAGTSENCAVSEELRRTAGCGRHRTRTVSTALSEWMRDHGENTDTPNSAQAVKWLSCAEHARLCSKAAKVPLDKRGPSARHPSIAERYRVGRTVHKAFNRMQGLRGYDGQIVQDPALVDQMLWGSRKGLWGSAPPVPEFADTFLQAYFRDRGAVLPDMPHPCSRDIAEKVLAAGGSAPGHNGVPYEPIIRLSSS